METYKLKTVLILMFFSASAVAQITDTSKFIWSRDGKVYIGNEVFQRWSGHFWDTLATKRYARSSGGGGGGGGTIDTAINMPGTGTGVYKGLSGDSLLFKKLVGSSSISIVDGTDSITFTASPSNLDSVRYITYPDTITFRYLQPETSTDTIWNGMNQTWWAKNGSLYPSGCIAISSQFTAPRINNPINVTFNWAGCIKEWIPYVNIPYVEVRVELWIKNHNSGIDGWVPIGSTTVYEPPNDSSWSLTVPLNLGTFSHNLYVNGSPGYAPTMWTYGVAEDSIVSFRVLFHGWGPCGGGNWDTPLISMTDFVITTDTSEVTPARYINTLEGKTDDWWVENNLDVYSDLTFYEGQVYNEFYIGKVGVGRTNVAYGYQNDTVQGGLYQMGPHGRWNQILSDNDSTQTLILPQIASGQSLDTLLTVSNFTSAYRIKELEDNTYFKYVQSDTGVTFTVSGDTLKIRASTGTAANASFFSMPAERPPTSAGAFDEEWDDANNTYPDTSTSWKWLSAVYNRSKLTLNTKNGYLIVNDTTIGTGQQNRLLGQKITDTAWSFTARVDPQMDGNNYATCGIFVFDSTTSKGYMFNFVTNNTDNSGLYHNISTFTSVTSASEVLYNRQRIVPTIRYMKIEKTSAKVLNFYRSSDGINFDRLYTIASTSYMESAGNKADWIGLVWGGSSTSGLAVRVNYGWFRYGWSADFDPTLHN